jgi:hypothetical protein
MPPPNVEKLKGDLELALNGILKASKNLTKSK